MPGLISQAIDPENTNNVLGYDAEKRTLDPATDTVEGRASKLIADDSPFIQSARARATGVANSRGLINSSMAVGAGEAAAYDAALPIASQDAAAYNQQGQLNQQAENTARGFTADSGNRLNLANVAGKQQKEQQLLAGQIETGLVGTRTAAESRLQGERVAGESQLQTERVAGESQLSAQQAEQAGTLQTQKAAQEIQMQNLRGDQAERITALESANRQLLQSSASATSVYSGIAKSINDIMSNADLSPADKQLAINRNIDLLESGLAVIGGIAGLNLTSLLNFNAP